MAALRLSCKLAAVLGGLLVFGIVVHTIVGADRRRLGQRQRRRRAAAWPTSWPTGSSCPSAPADWVAPVSYVSLVALALLLTLLKGWVRLAVLVPVLYLAAFVWENVMLAKPEPTRYIILGVLLIALMIARPSGLLGEKRVEII